MIPKINLQMMNPFHQRFKQEPFSSNQRKHYVKTRHLSNRPKSNASSRSYSLTASRHSQNNKTTFSSSSKTRSLSVNNHKLYQNLKRIKESNQNSRLFALKQKTQEALQNLNKETKLKLSHQMRNLHPFFSKINDKICQAMFLLGKITIYPLNKILSYNQYNSSICLQLSTKSNYIGFILYGKIQILNLKHFYSHIINLRSANTTVFQHNYIKQNIKQREKQIYEYDLQTLQQTAILWISKQILYLIRRQCFINMDLKYLFHQFENLLKYCLIHKKAKLGKK